jgi:uncharacterized protein YdeI (YjbR/CyaY-like superfamily)
MKKADPAYPQCRARHIGEWHSWLEAHHDSKEVIWLVFQKKGKGKGAPEPPFNYQQALDEALCYGWVDSLLKSIDENEYMRKFTPRKPKATWSEHNKRHVERLQREGRMKPAGLETIRVARENGMWDRGVQPPDINDSLPGALLHAFQSSPLARENYFSLGSRQQKQYNIWINMAKRTETITRRVQEAVEKLERGEELGLK